MNTGLKIAVLILCMGFVAFSWPLNGRAQTGAVLSAHGNEFEVEKEFQTANGLMDQKRFGEALAHYRNALAMLPDDPSILYNSGMAAFLCKDFNVAANYWKHLKEMDSTDWQARAKLIQTYQALGDVVSRDVEREGLFVLRKLGTNKELNNQQEYCREQFEVDGERVMAFEEFELKGDRALKYVFSVLDTTVDKEKYRISLGSYETTNRIWRATTKPAPKEGVRLYHLDGYFRNEHQTYGMYVSEPSYETIRATVVAILEKKQEPAPTNARSARP